MRDLDEIRQSFPQLNHIPDYDLAEMLHEKHFSNVPKDEYYRNIGIDVPQAHRTQPEDYQAADEAILRGGGRAVANLPSNIGTVVKGLLGIVAHPVESGKGFVAEGLRGGNTLVQNLPNNILEYLRESQARKSQKINQVNEKRIASGKQPLPDTNFQIPESISLDWASPETKQKMNDYVEKLAPEYDKSLWGPQLTGAIGRYAPATAIGGLAGPGGILAGIGAQSIAENENPAEAIATARLLHQTPKTAVKIAKKGLDKIRGPNGPNGGPEGPKSTKQQAKQAEIERERIKQEAFKQNLQDIESETKLRSETRLNREKQADEVDNLTKSLLDMSREVASHESTLDKSKRELAARTAASSEKNANALKEGNSKLENYAPRQEANAKNYSMETISEKAKELRNEANKNFENVYNQPIGNTTLGKTKINGSLTKSDIGAGFYKQAINGLKSLNIEIPDWLNKESKSVPTVKDMMEFKKLVQREKNRAGETSESKTKSTADVTRAKKLKPMLEALENRLQEDLEAHVEPKHLENINRAYQEYGNLAIPFDVYPFLEDITNKFGKVGSSNIYESIAGLGKGAQNAFKRLIQDPKVNEAIAKHDLMNFDLTTIDQISDLLNSDQGRSLPTSARNILEGQLKTLQKIAKDQKIAQAITASEIKSILNEPEIKNLLKDNPDIFADLDKIQTLKRGIKNLQIKMQETGFTKAEIESKIKRLDRDIRRMDEYIKSKNELQKEHVKSETKSKAELKKEAKNNLYKGAVLGAVGNSILKGFLKIIL